MTQTEFYAYLKSRPKLPLSITSPDKDMETAYSELAKAYTALQEWAMGVAPCWETTPRK